MTWSDVIATGIGGDGVEFRLVIEGGSYEVCTDGLVAGDCSETGQTGVRRVHGLLRESIGFAETAYLAGAKIDVSISPLRMVETPGPADLDALTSMFAALPTAEAWLSSSLTDTATSASVRGGAGLVAGGYYHLGTEVVRVDMIGSTSGGVTTLSAITRGLWRTTAQAHPIEATDGTPTVRAIRSAVNTWIGRRVWVYAHGADELELADTGTLIYRGVISSDPQLEGGDATTWILNVASRWTILEQEIGAGNDKSRTLAGIYYPGNHAFWVIVQWGADATAGGLITSRVDFRIAGFWATNLEWANHLAATLNADATISAAGFEFLGEVDDDGRWQLNVRIPSPTALYPEIWGGSAVDGWFDQGVRSLESGDPRLGTVSAGQTYRVTWERGADPLAAPVEEQRRVPRTQNIGPDVTGDGATDFALYPDTRVYLNSVRGLATNSTLTFSQRPDADGNEQPPHSSLISSVTSASGYVTLGVAPRLIAVGDWTQEITVTTRLSRFTASGDTLDDLRDRLVLLAPDEANSGLVPFVLGDDLADWTTVVDELSALAPEVYSTRTYLYTTGVRLSEIIQHEAMLLGAFFRLDADGKIDLRPLTIDTQPVDVDHVLSEDDGTILPWDGFGELTSGEDGNVNVVEIHRGYDPSEDKHTGGTVRYRSVEGMSEARKERVIEIKPKATSRREITSDDAQRIAQPVIRLFGGKIHHYTVTVPLSRFGVLVGDTVQVTSRALPYAGARAVNDSGGGMRSVRAIVVGRDWSDISSGRGRLTLLVTSGMSEVAGYSPSGRVSSATGSGTDWTVTLEANRYSPTGETDASYFVAGDRIELVEWDAASPTTRVGTVDSVSGNDVAVTLDASWAGLGGATYILTYSAADESPMNDAQFEYLAIAASTLRRIIPPGDEGPARLFAP